MNDPVKLVTTKPDAEVAKELKEELEVAAKAWLEACTKAHKAGFGVQANFGPIHSGQYVIQSLFLIRQY